MFPDTSSPFLGLFYVQERIQLSMSGKRYPLTHRTAAYAALPSLGPDGRQQAGSGRMNRLELPHAWRGLRGRISLFCLVWACHKKDYKYKHVGFALKAPDGTV